MGRFLIKSCMFFKRDFIENTTYKASFLLEMGGILANTLSFFFIAKLVGDSAEPFLQEYGGQYFPFVIIGIAFSGYMTASLNSYTEAIGKEQGLGTMEALLITPTGIPTIIMSGAIWNFVFTTVKVVIYLLLGALFFGLDLSHANIPAALLVLMLTIIAMSGFGIFSAGFTLILKKGDPVNFFVSGFSRFLAGVYFPITILPAWVQKLSMVVPLTYALHALRMTILTGAPLSHVYADIIALVIFSAVLLPFSILFFKMAVRQMMIDGSWTHY
jgi:ABC-2 type transport system permease protein